MARSATTLYPKYDKTVLLVCDVQTRLSTVVHDFDKLLANTVKLVNGCNMLNIPILYTEQYPKILGPTVSKIDTSRAKGPYKKTQGSMCTPEVREALSTICSGKPPETAILVGVEGHLCVEHTAMDLRNEGFDVHIVADCVASYTVEENLLALDRMKEMGCVITTMENIVFKLIRDSKHPRFREITKLIRPPVSHL